MHGASGRLECLSYVTWLYVNWLLSRSGLLKLFLVGIMVMMKYGVNEVACRNPYR